MVEYGRKDRKIGLFSRQNCQKSGKNPAKTAQNPGGGHHRPGAGRAELVTACHRFDPARGGGGASSARPVRGDLSSGAGCCCPLLYSYVGRGGGRSPTGAASSARRGAVAGRGLSSVQRWRGRSPTGAASSSRPRKTPHGKRATKKEVGAARAVSTSFFASNFRAAGITRRRCCCRPRRAAGIRRAPCGRRKRP